jgi:hypothetical protein
VALGFSIKRLAGEKRIDKHTGIFKIRDLLSPANCRFPFTQHRVKKIAVFLVYAGLNAYVVCHAGKQAENFHRLQHKQ